MGSLSLPMWSLRVTMSAKLLKAAKTRVREAIDDDNLQTSCLMRVKTALDSNFEAHKNYLHVLDVHRNTQMRSPRNRKELSDILKHLICEIKKTTRQGEELLDLVLRSNLCTLPQAYSDIIQTSEKSVKLMKECCNRTCVLRKQCLNKSWRSSKKLKTSLKPLSDEHPTF